MTVLSTTRLALRPVSRGDAERWHAVVWGDPDVACWLAPRQPIPADRLTRFIEQRALPHWAEYGFGIWLLWDRDSAELVGHCGLVVNEPGQVDLIYALGRAWWGHGLATEAARVVVAQAFGPIGLDTLVATVIPGNDASIHILDKLGFAPAGTTGIDGAEVLRYKCHREASSGQSPARTHTT